MRRRCATGRTGAACTPATTTWPTTRSSTIEFEGGVTATLTMSAFTPMGRRRTRIMGTRGFLEGDGQQLTLTDFVTGQVESFDLVDGGVGAGGGHDGGDFGVMSAFLGAVSAGDRSLGPLRAARVIGEPSHGVRRRAQPVDWSSGNRLGLAEGGWSESTAHLALSFKAT